MRKVISGVVITDKYFSCFMDRVEVRGEDECWPWKGCVAGKGSYGFMSLQWKDGEVAHRRGINAHRLAYLLFVGDIPEGYVVDHLCRNHICVNPKHLEAVTSKENQLRGNRNQFFGVTHCMAGHEFTPENTYVCKDGARHCKKCNALRVWQYKRRKKGASV